MPLFNILAIEGCDAKRESTYLVEATNKAHALHLHKKGESEHVDSIVYHTENYRDVDKELWKVTEYESH